MFTPIFHDIRAKHDRQASHDAFSVMTNAMGLIAILTAALGWFFSKTIAGFLVPGFEAEDLQRCASFFAVTSPLVIFQVINGMFSNFLRAEHFYGVTESMNFCGKIVNLLILLALGWTYGAWALVLGLWCGAVIRFAGHLIFVFRLGYRYRPIFLSLIHI